MCITAVSVDVGRRSDSRREGGGKAKGGHSQDCERSVKPFNPSSFLNNGGFLKGEDYNDK